MAKSKKRPGEKKLSSGAWIFNGRVKFWGSQDPKTFENVLTYECNKCGTKKEIRDEIPNLARRASFRAEAKAHDCEATKRSQQFIDAAREREMGRRDLNG